MNILSIAKYCNSCKYLKMLKTKHNALDLWFSVWLVTIRFTDVSCVTYCWVSVWQVASVWLDNQDCYLFLPKGHWTRSFNLSVEPRKFQFSLAKLILHVATLHCRATSVFFKMQHPLTFGDLLVNGTDCSDRMSL